MTSQKSVKIEDGQAWFDFECPGCHESGRMGVPLTDKGNTFACPGECGSGFIMWAPEGDAGPFALTCVVQAVYDDLACRVCGCTDSNPCLVRENFIGRERACSWFEDDLCDGCAEIAGITKVRGPVVKTA